MTVSAAASVSGGGRSMKESAEHTPAVPYWKVKPGCGCLAEAFNMLSFRAISLNSKEMEVFSAEIGVKM